MKAEQCRSVKMLRGEALRCEGREGHTSVHYCGSEWWPNNRGLPGNQRHVVLWGIWAFAALVLALAIMVVASLSKSPKRPPPKPRPIGVIEQDHPKVVCEVSVEDLRGMGEAMRDAMIHGRNVKWVEARGKVGDGEHLEIVTHTIPMPSPTPLPENVMD